MKKAIATLLLAAMMMSLCAGALAAKETLPANVNPQQMGHVRFLIWEYGETKAKEILKSYGTASIVSGGYLPVDDQGRDGSLEKPYIFGSVSSALLVRGVYFTMLDILYWVSEQATVNGVKMLVAYKASAAGVPDYTTATFLPLV